MRSNPPPTTPTSRNAPAVVAGEAAAEALASGDLPTMTSAKSAAFFDIDNTIVRGASLFHLARGLASRKFFSAADVATFAWRQTRYRIGGHEDLDDMATAVEAALAFVAGHRVEEVTSLADEIFDERFEGKLYDDTIAMARRHVQAGEPVWLVSAAPIELATVIARKLGLTGALGTVSEIVDGVYTGRLVGAPLHGPAKAEAVRALSEREGLDLSQCAAYSDSSNDIPMLSLVGMPVAVNPDSRLRRHARSLGWQVFDYRTGRKAVKIGLPTALVAGAAAGVALGVVTSRRHR
jgi:HAD superfamily hydrolase (TIGR01490 family)